MADRIECLNENYSTTRLCYRLLDDEYLVESGRAKEDLKFNINNSKFISKPDDKVETMLFLPEGEDRKGEGGLRTKGYFKSSYEDLIINDECLIINDEYGNEFKVDKYILKNLTFNVQHSKLNKLPLISIITVVYNGEEYLEETIQSVINQIYPNVEYIIIDGGSTDGTLDIIKKYEDYIDYWVSEKDEGIYDAMNKGIQCITGKIIGVIGSDDIYIKNIFSIVAMKKNEGIIYGNIIYINKFGHIIKKKKSKTAKYKYFMIEGMSIPHIGSFIDSKIIKKYGFYKTKFKYAADYEYYLKLYINQIHIKYIDIDVSMFRNTGATNKFYINSIFESFQIRQMHSVKLYLNLYFLIRTFVSKCVKKII